jgi:hypothetical protein
LFSNSSFSWKELWDFCQGPLRFTRDGLRNRRGNEKVGLQPDIIN